MDTNTKVLIVEDHFVEANHLRIMLKNAGYSVSGIARSTADARKLIAAERPGLVLLDIFLSGRETGIDLAKELKQQGIGFIYLSANSNEEILNAAKATHPYGFLVKPFREKDLLVMMQIAGYHLEHGIESSIRKEQLFQNQLRDIAGIKNDWEQRLLKVSQSLQPLIPFDLLLTVYRTHESQEDTVLGYLRTGFNEYRKITIDDLQGLSNLKSHEIKLLQEHSVLDNAITLYSGYSFRKATQEPTMKRLIAEHLGMRCNLTLPVPLAIHEKDKFYISFFSRKPDALDESHATMCRRLQEPLIYMVESILAQDNKGFSGRQASPSPVAFAFESGFEGIVGKNPLLLEVFDHIAQVAPADTTILITGESGTGKERIASSIHQLSPRAKKPLVKINCAALPATLIESELFGHEKGAFTGATERRVGKFEQAHQGTLFLDEIGELPLEMQVKLLRVLQEKELERLGGSASIKVDVRIVAATNRNLEKEVAEGRFRLDLYYRLNVFPIRLPALRERKDDIPLLAHHFASIYSKKNGKTIDQLSDLALKSMLSYDWPGNIRELENLMERSVLLAKGTAIESLPLPENPSQPYSPEKEWQQRTIEENERHHIIAALNKCNGRIRGENGAAAILGVPPTTLASKMLKLGIKRGGY
ncbi:sigma 54-interacting transcriptional regulator [Flavobacterium sp.]|uniref:sigma 54-interacting transcriptional regulator n=1 Tax=Flavobacterium sp. TaxID=239 RepID=UPI0039E38D3B